MPGTLDETRVVFREELRRALRSRGYLIIALSVPAILLLLVAVVPLIRGIADDEDEEPKPVGIVNLSENLSLDTADRPGIMELADREKGYEALAANSIKELFVIPRDYLATGIVDWVHKGGGANPDGASSWMVTELLRIALAGEKLPPDVLRRALYGTEFQRARLGPDGLPLDQDEEAEIGAAILAFLFAGMVLFAVFVGAGSLVQSVAEEKENRMIEVLLTSVRPLSIMAAKVLALGIAGLLLIAIWTGSILGLMPRIFDNIPDAPVFQADPLLLTWVVLFFLAGYFFAAVVLAGIGAATAGVKEANQAAALVIFPMMAPVYGLVIILPNPDGLLARTLSFIPVTAPITMMLRLGAGEPNPLEILGSLAVLVLTGLALLWVSARVFRAGLLMYGQRMGVRRILSTLREAD